MTAIKEGHDARIERAMKVVEDLKDKWDWKMRVTLDDPFEEDDDDDDDEEDLFGDDDMEPAAAPAVWDGTPKQVAAVQIPSQSDEVMRTQSQSTRMPTQSDEVMAAQSQTMDYSQNQSQSQTAMDVSSVDSSQPPPPTQVPPTQDTDMLFISDDSDDDGDLEDVMES
ncbi:hypothetical protein FRC18_007795 [Serendipita sp. 400]|nr:hypothetical protein FRC18_007795 [Serendipita sp. 400]